jgi:hypothetical protein
VKYDGENLGMGECRIPEFALLTNGIMGVADFLCVP